MASPALRRDYDDLQVRVADAVKTRATHLGGFSAHDVLSKQSDRYDIQEVRVSPGDVKTQDSHFWGLLDIYVMLCFNDDRVFDTAMGIVGTFHGHFGAGGEIVVDDIAINPRGIFE